jgi:hypothetical protein
MTPKIKRIALTGCLALSFVAYGLLLWQGPWWFDGAHLRRNDLQPADGVVITGFRTMLVALGAGFVAALGLYYTHKNHQHTEKLFDHTREKDREQAEINREGQVTERYVHAIKLLGSENLTERLGGIYSLERIMRDSEKDHPTVTEVLTAFIRDRARPSTPADAETLTAHPSEDIQAAISVLGRRPEISDAPLTNLAVPTVINNRVYGLRLQRITLPKASFRRAKFCYADLTYAEFTKADFREADLSGVKSRGINLRRTNLEQAKLSSAQLVNANLTGANLVNSDLSGTDLSGATLRGADLTGADLVWADLANTNFTETQAGTWMTGSAEARQEDAGLGDAQGLTVEQLAHAFIYRSTKLPAHIASDPRIQEIIEDHESRRAQIEEPK